MGWCVRGSVASLYNIPLFYYRAHSFRFLLANHAERAHGSASHVCSSWYPHSCPG